MTAGVISLFAVVASPFGSASANSYYGSSYGGYGGYGGYSNSYSNYYNRYHHRHHYSNYRRVYDPRTRVIIIIVFNNDNNCWEYWGTGQPYYGNYGYGSSYDY
jgi:hypothetical protein